MSAGPTYPSTHGAGWDGVKGREAWATRLPQRPLQKARLRPPLWNGGCRLGGRGGFAHTSEGAPKLSSRPCSAPQPATPAPCRPRPHSPAPEPARPPSAPSTGGRSRSSARSPMARGGPGRRGAGVALTRGRSPRAGGAQAAPGAGFLPLAPLIGDDGGGGVGSPGAAGSRGRAARDRARLRAGPRPPLRGAPLLQRDSGHPPSPGHGHGHSRGPPRSAPPRCTTGSANFYGPGNLLPRQTLIPQAWGGDGEGGMAESLEQNHPQVMPWLLVLRPHFETSNRGQHCGRGSHPGAILCEDSSLPPVYPAHQGRARPSGGGSVLTALRGQSSHREVSRV